MESFSKSMKRYISRQIVSSCDSMIGLAWLGILSFLAWIKPSKDELKLNFYKWSSNPITKLLYTRLSEQDQIGSKSKSFLVRTISNSRCFADGAHILH